MRSIQQKGLETDLKSGKARWPFRSDLKVGFSDFVAQPQRKKWASMSARWQLRRFGREPIISGPPLRSFPESVGMSQMCQEQTFSLFEKPFGLEQRWRRCDVARLGGL